MVTFVGGPVLALFALMVLAAVIFKISRRKGSVLTHSELPDSTRPLLTQRSGVYLCVLVVNIHCIYSYCPFPTYIVNEEDMERDHCETNGKITLFLSYSNSAVCMFKVLAIVRV